MSPRLATGIIAFTCGTLLTDNVLGGKVMIVRNETDVPLQAVCSCNRSGETGIVYTIYPESWAIVLGPEIGEEQCGRFGRAAIHADITCVPHDHTPVQSMQASVGPGMPYTHVENGLSVVISVAE